MAANKSDVHHSASGLADVLAALASVVSHGSRLLMFFIWPVLLAASILHAESVSGASKRVAGERQSCQIAVLRNGFSIQYAQQEIAGTTTRLWMCGDADSGYLDVPTDQIERFEEGQKAAAPDPPASVAEIKASTTLALNETIRNLIASAASRYQIDPDFVTSVVKAESGFNPMAVSPKGARGLMQLMPSTAAGLGVHDVLDPAANLEGGTKYLGQLLDQYKGDAVKALAAYNAGPQRVEQYGGVPPYPETRAYIIRIIDDYNRKKIAQQAHSTTARADK